MVKKQASVSFLAVLVMLVLCSRSVFLVFGIAVPSIELNEADAEVKEAFMAVSLAAGVGANVSTLVVMLNEAQGFLSQANASFLSGDTENASLLAYQCIVLANETAQNARDLQSQTERAVGDRLVFAGSFSAIGIAVLIVISAICWRRIRTAYVRRVLEMRPEKVSSTS